MTIKPPRIYLSDAAWHAHKSLFGEDARASATINHLLVELEAYTRAGLYQLQSRSNDLNSVKKLFCVVVSNDA